VSNGQVRYRTADFEVGFHLARPGFSFLGLHTEDPANIGTNLLSAKPAFFARQGPQLHELGISTGAHPLGPLAISRAKPACAAQT